MEREHIHLSDMVVVNAAQSVLQSNHSTCKLDNLTLLPYHNLLGTHRGALFSTNAITPSLMFSPSFNLFP